MSHGASDVSPKRVSAMISGKDLGDLEEREGEKVRRVVCRVRRRGEESRRSIGPG